MTSKYYVIMNKSPTVPKPYAVGIVEADDTIFDWYQEYINDRRDKYDPYGFIEWMIHRYDVKFYKPDSAMFKRHVDTALSFNFNKPLGRLNSIIKKVGNSAKRIRNFRKTSKIN